MMSLISCVRSPLPTLKNERSKMHFVKKLVFLPCLLFALTGIALAETTTDFPHRDTPEASIYRGDLVFHSYCQLCHGSNADGMGRAAKMYTPKPANLRKSSYNSEYKELIIRKGGKSLGRSEFMPQWEAELTDEQVADVVHYIDSIVEKK